MDLAAKLNRRVKLMKFEKLVDGSGNPVEDWVLFMEVWAGVEPIRGREYFAAAAVQSETMIRVRIRYRSGVNAGFRVHYDDRVLDVVGVIDPYDKHQELELMCKEVVENG
ncbi:phage head closure protein [Marininema halotolerans]|uniref:Phage head-tail adaptor, putative, SPP1 family n=1 Tax=Marininema halotolerans TaxID=1155944 RepID=A0A1I6URN2_9BACL|nr:phage head closure protein [Marininema halotolerans]SFT04108.1 phage head-tail adaptor, putative, SPP1 family [Marininema halotolerans]